MVKSTKSSTYLIIAMLAWGSVYPVSKYLMTDIGPMTMSFLRYAVAIITLSPFFIIEMRKNSKIFDRKSIIYLSAAGITGTAAFAFLLYAGVARSTASNGSILINTQPVFAAILAPLLLKEKISGFQIVGILTGFTGMFLVVTGGSFKLGENTMLSGNLILIAGAVSMTLYGIFMKEPIRKFGSLTATWISMAIGTAIILIINILINQNFFSDLRIPSGKEIILIIYLGSIATAAAYLLFSFGLHHIDVIRATAFKFLIPVTGVGLSVLFLGEKPAMAAYAGIIIVIFSIFLVQKDKNVT